MDKLSEDKLFLELQEAHLQPIEHNMEALDEAVAKRKSLGNQLKTIAKVMKKTEATIKKLSDQVTKDAKSKNDKKKTRATKAEGVLNKYNTEYAKLQESYNNYYEQMKLIADEVDENSAKDGSRTSTEGGQKGQRERSELSVNDLTDKFSTSDLKHVTKSDKAGDNLKASLANTGIAQK